MEQTKGKPGVMIYFDLLNIFDLLTDAQKGILFESILRYAKNGEEPKLGKHKLLEMAWCIYQQRLDMDDEAYRRKVARGKYAAYVRWTKKKGGSVLDYDDWVESGGPEEEKTYLDASDAIV